MRKLLLMISVVCALSAVAQTSVKMKTAKANGDEFAFVVNSGLECVVDWGDGKLDTLLSTAEPVSGTVAGKYITLKTIGLTYLDCSDQQINQLTFTACGTLETLICSNNKLITCTLTALPNLKTLWCDHNLLTALDLSKQTKLESLIADHNMLTRITRPSGGMPGLVDVWVNNTRMTSLDLTGCSKIQTLNVENNKMEQMRLSVLDNKAVAVFLDGNSLDFTSFWNKINVNKWYGTTQNIPFAQKSYNMGVEFTVGRDLFASNQDGVAQAAMSYTFSWYPYLFGVKGEKLVRGNETSENCDYSTPNTNDKKHLFTFKRAFDDVQLEIKNNKYLNFLLVSDHISIEDPTGVNDAQDTTGLTFKADNGAVVLSADQPAEVKIYDAGGTLRWQGTVLDATRIPLGKGVFIINNKKVSL